jgi:hypothetical protein
MKTYSDIPKRIAVLVGGAIVGIVRACLRVFCVMKWHPIRVKRTGQDTCWTCAKFVKEPKK